MNQKQRKRKQHRRTQHGQTTRTPDRPVQTFSGSGCPEVNDGHIVPRTYQKAWEGEHRQVARHMVGSSACEARSTKVTGTRGTYYRRTRPGGTEIDDIEASLARVEGKATPALRQIVAGESITEDRKAALAQLFGVQLIRGPAFFATHREIQLEVLAGATKKHFKKRHLAAVEDDIDLARHQVLDVLLSPTNRLVTMLSYAPKVAGILSLMRWQVLRFDKPVLAYSDNPVVLWPMNVERTLPFNQPNLGPLTMLEIRVPIAPDAAILMNWIDRGDSNGISMKRRAAIELNAFTIAQADKEWMHLPGHEPIVAGDIFLPLSRLIDPSYDRAAAEGSARRALAGRFYERSRKRNWVNELEVVVDITPTRSRRVAA